MDPFQAFVWRHSVNLAHVVQLLCEETGLNSMVFLS
jgi:hypothetical protein